MFLIVVALAGAQPHGAIERLAKGAELYADHNYPAAMAELLPAREVKLHAQDYVLWFLGQSAYYAGDRSNLIPSPLSDSREREADIVWTLIYAEES